MSRTQSIHSLFRGAAELAKFYRMLAFILELLAAWIAAWRTFNHFELSDGWLSLWIASLLLIGQLLRVYARSIYQFSEKCRRTSVRAFGLQSEVPAAVHSSLECDAPIFSEWRASRLPAQELNEYYEPSFPPGPDLLRELYSYSSFYTWQLLRSSGHVFSICAGIASLAGVLVIYWLALVPNEVSLASRIVEVVCSLSFVVLAGKSFDAAADAYLSSRECRTIADGLIAQDGGIRLEELVATYDVVRASGPAIPTRIYTLLRDRLQARWERRKDALRDQCA